MFVLRAKFRILYYKQFLDKRWCSEELLVLYINPSLIHHHMKFAPPSFLIFIFLFYFQELSFKTSNSSEYHTSYLRTAYNIES